MKCNGSCLKHILKVGEIVDEAREQKDLELFEALTFVRLAAQNRHDSHCLK